VDYLLDLLELWLTEGTLEKGKGALCEKAVALVEAVVGLDGSLHVVVAELFFEFLPLKFGPTLGLSCFLQLFLQNADASVFVDDVQFLLFFFPLLSRVHLYLVIQKQNLLFELFQSQLGGLLAAQGVTNKCLLIFLVAFPVASTFAG
jgi:hypothetical protein